jgi:F-type H+-transporting ATPase subunit g
LFDLTAYKQPLLYKLSVTREVAKQIYIAEGLQPPTLGAIRAAYETLWTRAINPAYWRQIVGNGEIVRVGIYGVEAYTIFKVGFGSSLSSFPIFHANSTRE